MVAASLLKLLEMRSVRDAYFAFLVIFTQRRLLFKQNLLFTLYALLVFLFCC